MKAFKNLPETLDEIDARLNEERARSECLSGLSESVSALVNRLVDLILFFESIIIIPQVLYTYAHLNLIKIVVIRFQ